MRKTTMVFVSTVAMMLLCVSVSAKQVYFKAPHWGSDGAKFGVHSWGTGSEVDALMTKVAGTDIYEATVDDGAHSYIFLRLSKDVTSFDWSKEWNRTPNQENVTGNLCTVTNGSWGNKENGEGCTTEWSTYTPVAYNLSIDAPKGKLIDETIEISTTPVGFTDAASTTFEVKVPEAVDYEECTMPYQLSVLGDYVFIVTVSEGENSVAKEATVKVFAIPEDIVVRVKRPAEWTNDLSIHYWNDYMESGSPVAMTAGENGWYSYTFTRFVGTEVNVIFVHGDTWGGDANQTEDVLGITSSTDYELNSGEANGKYTVSIASQTPTSLDQSTLISRVFAQDRQLTVQLEGTASLAIYSLDGKMLENTTVNGSYTRSLNSGMYFVRIGKDTHKVIVK